MCPCCLYTYKPTQSEKCIFCRGPYEIMRFVSDSICSFLLPFWYCSSVTSFVTCAHFPTFSIKPHSQFYSAQQKLNRRFGVMSVVPTVLYSKALLFILAYRRRLSRLRHIRHCRYRWILRRSCCSWRQRYILHFPWNTRPHLQQYRHCSVSKSGTRLVKSLVRLLHLQTKKQS